MIFLVALTLTQVTQASTDAPIFSVEELLSEAHFTSTAPKIEEAVQASEDLLVKIIGETRARNNSNFDLSCMQINSGNKGGNGADKDYQLFMAKSFVKQMCYPASLVPSAPVPKKSSKDVMADPHYSMGKMKSENTSENLVPLFATLYAHGKRETSGNPMERTDFGKTVFKSVNPSATQLAKKPIETRERGLFHFSPNILNYAGTANHPEMNRIASEYIYRAAQLTQPGSDSSTISEEQLNALDDMCGTSAFASAYTRNWQIRSVNFGKDDVRKVLVHQSDLDDEIKIGMQSVADFKTPQEIAEKSDPRKISFLSLKFAFENFGSCVGNAAKYLAPYDLLYTQTASSILSTEVPNEKPGTTFNELDDKIKLDSLAIKRAALELAQKQEQLRSYLDAVRKNEGFTNEPRFQLNARLNYLASTGGLSDDTLGLVKIRTLDFISAQNEVQDLEGDIDKTVRSLSEVIQQLGEMGEPPPLSADLDLQIAYQSLKNELERRVRDYQASLKRHLRKLEQSRLADQKKQFDLMESSFLQGSVGAAQVGYHFPLPSPISKDENKEGLSGHDQTVILKNIVPSLLTDIGESLAVINYLETKKQKRSIAYNEQTQKLRIEFLKKAQAFESPRNSFNYIEPNVVRCLHSLSRYCPAFSVDFQAVAARTNKQHFGPYLEHSMVPACGKMFSALLAKKSTLCRNLEP